MASETDEKPPGQDGLSLHDLTKPKIATKSASDRKRQQNMADGKSLQEQKRRKWLAKQRKNEGKQNEGDEREKWFQRNCHYAFELSLQDLDQIQDKQSLVLGHDLESILAPLKNLQEGGQQSLTTAEGSHRYFIAEGTETVRLLIQQFSDENRQFAPIEIRSVMIKSSSFFDDPVLLKNDVQAAIKRNGNESTEQAPCPANGRPPFLVMVASEEVLSKIVGFPFSRGAIACGVVPSWYQDEDWLITRLTNIDAFSTRSKLQSRPRRLLALDGICDTANLGSIIRCASAFAIDALILSQDCCDAWYRRAVRVSMGHCCRVPCVRVANLSKTLQNLHKLLEVISFAAVVDPEADCILEKLTHNEVGRNWLLVIGNEGSGVSNEVVRASSKTVRIDMDKGVDSLSAPIATGILLHGLRERELR